jgi:hypothetical protein
MELIQLFNYLFALLAVVLASGAFWWAWRIEAKHDIEVKSLYERIRQLSDRIEQINKGRRLL